MTELTGGAFFDSRVRDWVDYIFEKDPNSPSTIIVHANHLAVPEGIDQYSSPQESVQRNEVYNIQALLNAYRMRQLCAVDNLLTSSESLLHAHAELFLSKGYAAWNLTGKSKADFEERLKRFTDPTLSRLFMGDAPVCSTQENEILQASELRERVLELERENVNFKAISEQAAEEMVDLRDKLQEKTEQIRLMELHLKETIETALAAKHQELEKLRGDTDLIVATALQEHQDTQLQTFSNQKTSLATLEEYAKSLERRNKQLEHYLLLAKDALLQSKAEKSIGSNVSIGNVSSEKKRVKQGLFLLSQNNNDLSGGASKVYIPALNTKNAAEFSGGSTSLPLQPRINGRDTIVVETIGGLPTTELADTRKKYYYVVNSMGVPVKNGEVSYLAASPSSAAVKAFYAWWRTSKQGSKCLERDSVTDFRTSLVPPELLQHLMAMQTDKVTNEDKKEYVKQFLCIDSVKIQRQILIRIGAAGGKSSVRAYLVGYKKNLSPNPLEVLNKMVVIASATPIPLTNVIPSNVIEYETL